MSHKSRIKETAITIVITNNRDYFQHTNKMMEREKPSTRRNKTLNILIIRGCSTGVPQLQHKRM